MIFSFGWWFESHWKLFSPIFSNYNRYFLWRWNIGSIINLSIYQFFFKKKDGKVNRLEPRNGFQVMQMGSINPHTLVHPVTQRPPTPPPLRFLKSISHGWFLMICNFSNLIILKRWDGKTKLPSPLSEFALLLILHVKKHFAPQVYCKIFFYRFRKRHKVSTYKM